MTDSVQWSSIPSLADKISKEDVHQKGKGHFACDYVSWAKTAQLMNEYANGWLFALVKTLENNWVHAAPDGTGFLVGVFIGPEGQQTPEFPYAITNHKNETIPVSEIGARAFTDSHRRAFCAAAAWQFNLAYQLWAREEIEAPEDSSSGDTPAPAPKSGAKAGKVSQARKPAAAPEGPGPANKQDRAELIAALGLARDKDQEKFSEFVNKFRAQFNLPSGQPIRDLITSEEHIGFCQSYLNSLNV